MNNLPSIKTIRDELSILSNKELIIMISALIKFKKENKELVTYLLFDSKDEGEYIRRITDETNTAMESVNRFNAKQQIKHIRKVLRNIKKAIKISGNHETAIRLLLHFCSIMKEKNLPIYRFKGINLIWERCIGQIESELLKIHEDLRFDYGVELKKLKDQ